ncbi:hypothetical protein AU14_12725 [Marinobacter similis]|uniref:WavQ n=1 Tax=Marinobacter similis TaxID=1420916 RepID=W5YLP3_9GAMM|nr:hypothetical protein AU14_12725 [Marinobacter similis]
MRGWVKLFRWFKLLLINYTKKRSIKSPYNLKISKKSDLKGAIVIYPEITAGNPLGAKFVVRWLLNKPGVINGNKDFGNKEIFFFYDSIFNDWDLNPNEGHHLIVSELKSDIYRINNESGRAGQCYMIRKGRDRALDYHEPGAINVDGMTHEELSIIFNECKYFICYDLYTMYSRYAAMCGCIPIVVPQTGVSLEEWYPDVENRYGIAYGWDNVSWAVESREKLLETLAEKRIVELESVDRFVLTTERYFFDELNKTSEL